MISGQESERECLEELYAVSDDFKLVSISEEPDDDVAEVLADASLALCEAAFTEVTVAPNRGVANERLVSFEEKFRGYWTILLGNDDSDQLLTDAQITSKLQEQMSRPGKVDFLKMWRDKREGPVPVQEVSEHSVSEQQVTEPAESLSARSSLSRWSWSQGSDENSSVSARPPIATSTPMSRQPTDQRPARSRPLRPRQQSFEEFQKRLNQRRRI